MQTVVEALRVLSLEARRKHPKVKEASERAILIAHSTGVRDKESSLILLPIYLAFETRDERMELLALNTLQKLISGGGLNLTEEIPKMLENLEEVIS